MDSVFDKNLASFFPIDVRKKDGEWKTMNLLLDTGFDGELEIDTALFAKYDLATRPDHQGLTPDAVLKTPNIWSSKRPYEDTRGPKRPYEGTIVWDGMKHNVGIRPVEDPRTEGMIGTELLRGRRLTADVMEGGAVNIGKIPRPRFNPLSQWRLRRTTKQIPPREYVP